MRRFLLHSWILIFSVSLAAFSQSKTTKPFVIGVIEELYSNELQEKRHLNIYLPEGYSPDSAALYPVIYLLDGSTDEDFIHVSGLVQFYNFPWIDVLPKSIVVGITNRDRKRDFTYPTTIEKDKKDFPTTGGSSQFISFLEKELQPYIQKNYKVSNSKMLIGQSLGGLLATEILFKKPSMFDQYIIVSPSLWWDKESLLKLSPVAITQPTKVIVAVGKEGRIMERDAKKLYQFLKHQDSAQLKVGFDYLKNKNHATIYHQALANAFMLLKAL